MEQPITTLGRERLAVIESAIMPHLHRTPILHSATLSRLTGHDVYLKAELFQKTGSYKPRGMLWALMSMSTDARERGVITFSAGNAAQGLAYAGNLTHARVTVTMPATASPIKVEATRAYGAEVILHGTPQECHAYCQSLVAERALTFISSYDSITLMEGHATLGQEILEDIPSLDVIFLGVGGGGMLGGLVMALEAFDHPARLIGVEPAGASAMHMSFATGHAVKLDRVDTIADGLAAPTAGEICYALASRRGADIIVVDDDAIIRATRFLMERCKLFAEPAGAASVAGLLANAERLPSRSKVLCVISGGNFDVQRLKALL